MTGAIRSRAAVEPRQGDVLIIVTVALSIMAWLHPNASQNTPRHLR